MIATTILCQLSREIRLRSGGEQVAPELFQADQELFSGDGLYQTAGIAPRRQGPNMSLATIILIILVIALLGGFSGIGGGPFYGTGYYGGGGLGLVIVILLILLLLGKL